MRGFPGHPGHSQDTPGEVSKVFPLRLAMDKECLGVLGIDGVLGIEGVLGVVCLDLVVRSAAQVLARETGDEKVSKPAPG